MCQLLNIIDNEILSVAQWINKVKFITEFDYFAEVEIVSDESLQSMIENKNINKFSGFEHKCAGYCIFRNCSSFPVYNATIIYSISDEMETTYHALVEQLLNKLPFKIKKLVEKYYSEVTDAAVNHLNRVVGFIEYDIHNLMEEYEESQKRMKYPKDLLHTKRQQLSLLSRDIKNKIKTLV